MDQRTTQFIERAGTSIRALWLNPRRKRFWAIVAVLLYTLLGFFAVPVLVKNSIISLVEEDFGRSAKIEKVEFNPYVLSLKVTGFGMHDTDGVQLAAFDEFFVNFQLSSLFRWAWTFDEIRLAGSYFLFERFDVDDSRLSRLLDEAERRALAQASTNSANATETPTGATADIADDAGLPRLLIHNLSVTDGQGNLKDNVPASPVEMALGPINISIQELNTLPDRYGAQNVTVHLPNGASLHWEGSLSLAPLDSEGELVLKNSRLDQTIAYLEATLPLESISARLSSRFHYRIKQQSNGELSVEIDGMEIELDELAVRGLTPVTDFLAIDKISLHGGTLRYPEQSLHFSSVRIDQPNLTAWLDTDGLLSLEQLASVTAADTGATQPDEQSAAWQLGLDEMVIAGGSLDLSDQTVNPAASVGVRDLQVKLTDISNQDEALFPLDVSLDLAKGGSFALNGKLGLFPGFSFAGNSRTRKIPLSLGQAYAQQLVRVLIESGELDSDIELSIQGEQIAASGAMQIHDLKMKDSIKKERLLEWKKLDIDRFELDPASNLHLSTLVFEQPFARLVIRDDQTTNLSDLEVIQDDDTAQSSEAANFVVGGIRIDDASMDFADFSLPLPFATHITGMSGTISTIDSDSTAPANIKLEGKVDEFGLARIDGSIDLFDPIRFTDMTLEFRNLLMSNLSPYTVQFAGREIAEGKMDLDLGYAIDNGQLDGRNNIVLSDLVLGDKVDHPDASSLPLGLAVALLKDSDGVIDLDLPITGDINDPEFKISGVVWQAISGLITKIVSAPFRFLGKLIGIDAEDLGEFQFLAGRADLTPPELEKIAQLEEALQQRPELSVDISGVTDPAIDVPALKYIRLRDTVRERMGQQNADEDDETMMLDVEIRTHLESIFVERHPDIPLDTLKADHTAPPTGDPEGTPVLDELAYATDLKDRLLASEAVGEQDLAELALARADAIRSAFLANGQFDPGRVVISEAKQVQSEDGEWVTLELAVAP